MEPQSKDPLSFLVDLAPEELAAALVDEPAALAFLEDRRWSGGVRCPACDSGSTYSIGGAHSKSRHLHGCRDCSQQFSWRTGSIFKGSRNSPLEIVTAAGALVGGLGSAEVVHVLEQGFGFRRPRAQRLVTDLMELRHTGAAGEYQANEAFPEGQPSEGGNDSHDSSSSPPEPPNPVEAPEFATEVDDVSSEASAPWLGQAWVRGALLAAAILLALTVFVIRSSVSEAGTGEVWVRSWSVGDDRVDVTSGPRVGESREEWVQRFDDELRELEIYFPPTKNDNNADD